MKASRLQQQLDFIIEVDKLKGIFRQNYLIDGSRKENDAEHSWHCALMLILLAEHMPENLDVLRSIKMMLIHDLVEIYVGDVYCYDEKGNEGKFEREHNAALEIFALLPSDQSQDFLDLWLEFETMKTAEAQLAAMIDRLQPLLLNIHSCGRSWKEHDIVSSQVRHRNQIFDEGPKHLRQTVHRLIDDAVFKGYLKE